MRHVGIDVQLRRSSVCVLDEHGQIVERATFHGPWTGVVAWLGRIEAPFEVCFEASCGYGPLPSQPHPWAAPPGDLKERLETPNI